MLATLSVNAPIGNLEKSKWILLSIGEFVNTIVQELRKITLKRSNFNVKWYKNLELDLKKNESIQCHC